MLTSPALHNAVPMNTLFEQHPPLKPKKSEDADSYSYAPPPPPPQKKSGLSYFVFLTYIPGVIKLRN
jgi:hypothetical protein